MTEITVDQRGDMVQALDAGTQRPKQTNRKDGMTTATPTKPKSTPEPKNVLKETIAHEQVWDAAESEAKRLGREHSERLQRLRELAEDRQALAHREPALVTHTGEPVDPDNDVAKVKKQIEGLGDPADSAAKVEHARRLAQRAKQDVLAYRAAHFDAIVESLEPKGVGLVAESRELFKAVVDFAERYGGFVGRIEGLKEGNRPLYGLRVPGVDEAGELLRIATRNRDTDLPNLAELGR